MSYYREQLEKYLKGIDVKADRVMDLGGASNPVKGRVKSWDVKEYVIWDNNIERGETNLHFDLNTQFVGYEKREYFDIVFCLEVFEYIWDPVFAMKSIYDLLKPGGSAYITFPFVYCQHNPIEFDFLRYTPNGAKILLKACRFEVSDIVYRLSPTGVLTEFYELDKMRMAKGVNHDILGSIIKAKKLQVV